MGVAAEADKQGVLIEQRHATRDGVDRGPDVERLQGSMGDGNLALAPALVADEQAIVPGVGARPAEIPGAQASEARPNAARSRRGRGAERGRACRSACGGRGPGGGFGSRCRSASRAARAHAGGSVPWRPRPGGRPRGRARGPSTRTRAWLPAPPAARRGHRRWRGGDRRRRSRPRPDRQRLEASRAARRASRRRSGRSPHTAAACSPRRPGPRSAAPRRTGLRSSRPGVGGGGGERTATSSDASASSPSTSSSVSCSGPGSVSESCGSLTAEAYSRNPSCGVTLNRASDGKNRWN